MVLVDAPADIEFAADLLRRGEIVALPTETVYGLAANALDTAAVKKIFAAKSRPFYDPLIVHIAEPDAAGELAELDEVESTGDGKCTAGGQLRENFRRLADAFWPGPLTIVVPKKPVVPAIVTGGLPTVALRCPAHPLMQKVLRAAGIPLAAPSANPFGYVSPTTAQHVIDSLGERAPWVLDGGNCTHGVESTIVLLTGNATSATGSATSSAAGGAVRLLRPGPISWEEICAVLSLNPLDATERKNVTEKENASATGTAGTTATAGTACPAPSPAPLAPGMLTRHYSPRTPLILHPFGTLRPPPPTAGETTAASETATTSPATTQNPSAGSVHSAIHNSSFVISNSRSVPAGGVDSEICPSQFALRPSQNVATAGTIAYVFQQALMERSGSSDHRSAAAFRPPPSPAPGTAATSPAGSPPATTTSPAGTPHVFAFSATGTPAEVARNVFAILRYLDTLNLACAHIELAEERGLGTTINDRLRRAAAKR